MPGLAVSGCWGYCSLPVIEGGPAEASQPGRGGERRHDGGATAGWEWMMTAGPGWAGAMMTTMTTGDCIDRGNRWREVHEGGQRGRSRVPPEGWGRG